MGKQAVLLQFKLLRNTDWLLGGLYLATSTYPFLFFIAVFGHYLGWAGVFTRAIAELSLQHLQASSHSHGRAPAHRISRLPEDQIRRPRHYHHCAHQRP